MLGAILGDVGLGHDRELRRNIQVEQGYDASGVEIDGVVVHDLYARDIACFSFAHGVAIRRHHPIEAKLNLLRIERLTIGELNPFTQLVLPNGRLDLLP